MNPPEDRQSTRVPVASADEDPNVDVTCYASPPCLMHELDPSYFGALSRAEVLDLLGWLLAGERGFEAGAAGAPAAGEDERFVTLLEHWMRRLGAPAQPAGAGTADMSGGAAPARLREALPRVADDDLRRDLQRLLEAREARDQNG